MFRSPVLPLWKAFECFHKAPTLLYPLHGGLSTLFVTYSTVDLKGFLLTTNAELVTENVLFYCFRKLLSRRLSQPGDPQRLYFSVTYFLHNSMYFILCIKDQYPRKGLLNTIKWWLSGKRSHLCQITQNTQVPLKVADWREKTSVKKNSSQLQKN